LHQAHSPDGNGSLVKQKGRFCRCGGATLEATTKPNKNLFLQASYSGQLELALSADYTKINL